MTITRNTLVTGLLLASFVAAAPAHAALVQVTSIPGSTLNPVVFNDAPGATYAGPKSYPTGNRTATFSTSGGNGLERDQANVQSDPNPYLDSNFAAGTQLIAQCGYGQLFTCNPAGATTIGFAAPVFGFTLSADDFDTTQSYTFTVQVFSGANSLGSLTASSLADNAAAPALLAALSTDPITSIVITDTAASAPDGDFVLANIATVPEPASLGLLTAGLLALTGLNRRRR